jgi:aryl-alcohol dehydrogenase-like predicted oxidoreductase
MRYNPLGRTGLFVSELALGTMTFGENDPWGRIGVLDQPSAQALVARALESGINLFDTADVYSGGQSESILGKSLKNLAVKREDVVIATKVFGPQGEGPNARGASRAHIVAAVQASLQRLELDYIDLYQIHGFDVATPIEETVRALETLVQHGLVRYVGVSNWAAWQLMKALGIADRLGIGRVASLQAYYSLAGRDVEREIVPMLQSEGVGLLVWSPLAGGLLSGKFARGTPEGDHRRATLDFPPVDPARADAVITAMRPMAEARRVSVASIALAWLLDQPAVTSVLVGAKRIEQLEDNIAATHVVLSPEELARLDGLSRSSPEYPGWMAAAWDAGRPEQLREAAVRRGG